MNKEELKELEKSEEKKGFKWTNLEQVFEVLNKQQARINKAIEYIETWCYDEYSIAIKTGDKTCSSEPKAIDKLLDILKGKDE